MIYALPQRHQSTPWRLGATVSGMSESLQYLTDAQKMSRERKQWRAEDKVAKMEARVAELEANKARHERIQSNPRIPRLYKWLGRL
jgi:hypothetical protein